MKKLNLLLIVTFFIFFCVQPSRAQTDSSSASTTIRPVTPTLIVGIPSNSPPISFLNDKGTAPRGLAVDLGTLLAGQLRQQVRFIMDTPYNLETRLENGNIDMIIGVPPPAQISPHIDSIVTPFALNRRILVAAPEAHVTCEQDFFDQRILVVDGDPYLSVVVNAGGIPVVVENHQEALSLLVRGEADAYISRSGEVATYTAQRMGMTQVRFMGISLERIPLLIQIKTNDDLHGLITDALSTLEQSRQLGLLREKWLGRNLSQQNVLETYRDQIFYALCGVLLIILLVILLIVALRRQVAKTTKDLQSSEKRYRELIEASPDMTMLLDVDGSIRLTNRTAREILGLRPDQEQGSRALWEAMCEQGRTCLHTLLERAMITGQPVKEEIILNAADERSWIMEFIAFPTVGDDEDDHLICCIGRDMTERRHLENELIEVERLAIIGKTAASIAHEINNPLGIIMAHTDVALEEGQSEEMSKHLEAIQRNVERAATSTRRLLNIAMPTDINQEPQNLADILKESVAFLKPRMKNVQLDLRGLADELEIHGDRILLEQVFINLLLNSLESMEETGQLTINGSRQKTAKGDAIRIEIHDSGKGIAAENIERVFDPFFTTRGSKGFGLGLFISRRIVEAHKGVLYAESCPGRGASMIAEFAL